MDEDESVEAVINRLKENWGKIKYQVETPKDTPYESDLLKLDCTKAWNCLRWKPVWEIDASLEKTISWYRDYYEKDMVTSLQNLFAYVETARGRGLVWLS